MLVTAILSGNVVTFYKGQNAGDPTQMVTSADVENAMSISLQGYFQIEDE